MDNARYPKYLCIFGFYNHANNLAKMCIICNYFHTRINTYILNNYSEQLTHIFCIIVSSKSIHHFQEDWSIQGRHHEVDEWMAYVHPLETMLAQDDVHVDLIGSNILSTSFSLANNVVLSLSKPGGTYHVGAP